MKRDMDRKITVEDLLRLKRAERPPDEFWATFEAEIRSKQLSAIVSRRPWWDRFSGVFAALNRHQVSIGAACALALAISGYRYVGVHSDYANAGRASAAQPAAVAAVTEHATQAAPAAPAVTREASEPEESGFAAFSARDAAPRQTPVVAATSSHLTQAPAALVADSIARTSFADGIAVTLADYREPVSDYAQRSVFGSDREFEASYTPARQPQADPLAGMDPAAERRARLLAPALPAGPHALAVDWMKERAASNDRMYESMDQGSNDRMLVGFRF